jgi:hypothetical protein
MVYTPPHLRCRTFVGNMQNGAVLAWQVTVVPALNEVNVRNDSKKNVYVCNPTFIPAFEANNQDTRLRLTFEDTKESSAAKACMTAYNRIVEVFKQNKLSGAVCVSRERTKRIEIWFGGADIQDSVIDTVKKVAHTENVSLRFNADDGWDMFDMISDDDGLAVVNNQAMMALLE